MHSSAVGRLSRSNTLSMSLNLELSKVDKDLLEVCAGQLEVFNSTLSKHSSELVEDITKKYIASLDIDTLNTITNFNESLGLGGGSLIASIRVVRLSRAIVHQLSRRKHLSNDTAYTCLLVVKLLLLLLKLNGVSSTILSLQIVRCTENNETTVDLDSQFVAELLSLVHAMSSKKH